MTLDEIEDQYKQQDTSPRAVLQWPSILAVWDAVPKLLAVARAAEQHVGNKTFFSSDCKIAGLKEALKEFEK